MGPNCCAGRRQVFGNQRAFFGGTRSRRWCGRSLVGILNPLALKHFPRLNAKGLSGYIFAYVARAAPRLLYYSIVSNGNANESTTTGSNTTGGPGLLGVKNA